MALADLAAELNTIQSRRKLPFKAALSQTIREDLAMRFSVYNLVKTVTRSQFIATIAHKEFGNLTPGQKRQQDEEKKKSLAETRFKQFTVGSIKRLSNKVNLLASITERNTSLITNLYNDLGYFKGARKLNPMSISSVPTRVPIRNKTVKGQIDLINKQLTELRQMRSGGGKPKRSQPANKDSKKSTESFFDSLINGMIKNPWLLGAMSGRGMGRAISLAGLAAPIYSIASLPGAAGRIADRLQGKNAGGVSDVSDPLVAATGTYFLGKYATTAGAAISKRYANSPAGKASAKRAYKERINSEVAKGKAQGLTGKESLSRATRLMRRGSTAKKFLSMSKFVRGFAKKLPGASAAFVAYDIAKMAGNIADRDSGKMSSTEFKNKMIGNYAELVSDVGVTGMSTILGSMAGTYLFPGLGTVAGGIAGMGIGTLLSFLINEDSKTMRDIGEKIYNIIHEDRTIPSPGEESPKSQDRSTDSSKVQTSTGMKPATLSKEYLEAVSQSGSGPEAVAFFQSKGWSLEQSAGIVANLLWESGLKTNAIGDSGSAYGIAQWHPDRQNKFAELYNKPIQQATLKEQLEFVHWELNNESVFIKKKGLDKLRSATTAGVAAAIVSEDYERPRDPMSSQSQRVAIARGLAGEKRSEAQSKPGSFVNPNPLGKQPVTPLHIPMREVMPKPDNRVIEAEKRSSEESETEAKDAHVKATAALMGITKTQNQLDAVSKKVAFMDQSQQPNKLPKTTPMEASFRESAYLA